MVKEKCTCGNMVVGVFTPSDTRRYLTGLAKKGGMKAVLAALGSVVPGIGNVGGLLIGTLIDVKYGKDVDRFIDKVADIFEDKKVYVFECPNCGRSWAFSKDLNEEDDNLVDDLINDSDEDILSHNLSMQLQEMEAVLNEAKKYDILSEDFYKNAMISLNMARDEYNNLEGEGYAEVDDPEMKEILKSQLEIFYDNIIRYIASECKGSMNCPVAADKSTLNQPFSMQIYGEYPIDMQGEEKMLVGVVLKGTAHVGQQIDLSDCYDESDLGDGYPTIQKIVMFGKLMCSAEAGDVCAIIVPLYFIDEESERCPYNYPSIIESSHA